MLKTAPAVFAVESGYLDVQSEVLIELSKFYNVSVNCILGLKD